MSQADAYREIYPKSRKWTIQSVAVKASKLAAKVQPIIKKLNQKAVSEAVASRQERLEALTRAMRDAAPGLKPYLKSCTPDGDLSFDINPENITGAIEMIEQRIQPAPEGSGEQDAVIRKIKVRDFLPYIQELNKMDGQYAPAQHEIAEVEALVIPWKPLPKPSEKSA